MRKTWMILLIVACILLQTACVHTPQTEGDSTHTEHTKEHETVSSDANADETGQSESEGAVPDGSSNSETVPQEDNAVDDPISNGDEDVYNDTPVNDDEDVYTETEYVDFEDSYEETVPGEYDDYYDETVSNEPYPDTTPDTPAQTDPVIEPEYTTPVATQSDVADPLTWSDINAIPIANSGMSVTQLRKICTDFMRLQLSFAWTPSQDLSYSVANKPVYLSAGTVYGGLPYVSSTFGNLYKAMEYYDEKTGVIDVSAADGNILNIIGNPCSASAYWAWSRVSNAISFGGTQTMLEKNGCLRVGNYTYSSSINNFHTESIRTANICIANGEQTMYEAYALLLPADGLSMYTGTAGHVRMVSGNAHVVRNSDGTINPDRSSITFLDQVSAWTVDTQSNGKMIRIQGGVDVTVSFRSLYNAGYLPFRIPELADKDGVEKASVSSSLSGNSVSVSALSGATVSANYPLSDVTVTVKDSSGKAVYRYTNPINDLNIRQSSISGAVKVNALFGYRDGTYTVEISCRVGTGEKLTAYSGKLTK